MVVAEYCSNCDRKTMRQTEPCQVCTPENVESQTTDTQQLKAEIAALLDDIGDPELYAGRGIDMNMIVDRLRQLSAV